MARNIDLPIAFEWQPSPASWSLVNAEITGWAQKQLEPCFRANLQEHGGSYELQIPWWALPPETLRLLRKEKSAKFTRKYAGELLLCSLGTRIREKRREANPWAMQEEFLRLKRTPPSLLAFLNKWGVWGPTRTSRPASPEVKAAAMGRHRLGLPPLDLDPKRMPHIFGSPVDASALNYLFPAEVWAFQKQCRDALTHPAHEWLAQKLIALVARPRFPYLVSTASNCQEAIRTSITIDLLQKVEFRICARPDCAAPFSVETRHQRKYCRQYCAHIESVRKQRQAKNEVLQGKV
jgi:hypothetical protein